MLSVGQTWASCLQSDVREPSPHCPHLAFKRLNVEQWLRRERVFVVKVTYTHLAERGKITAAPSCLPLINQSLCVHIRNRNPAAPPATLSVMSERPPRKSAEERNEAVRQGLKPLAPGERPGAVTISAVIAFALAITNLVMLATGFKVRGGSANPFGGILFGVLMLAAAGGMWKCKYWAVMGFQAILGLSVVICMLSLIRAATWQGFLIPTAFIVFGGWLFWKLIRAMARIQMPTRGSRSSVEQGNADDSHE